MLNKAWGMLRSYAHVKRLKNGRRVKINLFVREFEKKGRRDGRDKPDGLTLEVE